VPLFNLNMVDDMSRHTPNRGFITSDFLHGDALSKAVREMMKRRPLKCAVAFWGNNAVEYLEGSEDLSEVDIVCNLFSNGTNPDAIEKLISRKARIRNNPSLHAKVYISGQNAIVTSANASGNGLHLEEEDEGGWTEAGVAVEDNGKVTEWFDELFRRSFSIEPADIENAKRLRKKRGEVQKVVKLKFDKYLIGDHIPYVCHYPVDYEGDSEVVDESAAEYFGRIDDKVREKIRGGMPMVEFERVELVIGRSILWLEKRRDGKFRKDVMYFSHHNNNQDIVPNSMTIDGAAGDRNKLTDTAIFEEDESRDPFDARDKVFRAALLDVLSRPVYLPIAAEEEVHPWFTDEKIELMEKMWKDVAIEYKRLST